VFLNKWFHILWTGQYLGGFVFAGDNHQLIIEIMIALPQLLIALDN
jgi:hypothetical protein